MRSLIGNLAEERTKHTNRFIVELEFRDKILGGHPKNPEVLRNHLIAKLDREAKEAIKRGEEPPSEERREELMQAHLERMFGASMEETIDHESEKSWTTFNSDEVGPYIEAYQVNAMLREMASTT